MPTRVNAPLGELGVVSSVLSTGIPLDLSEQLPELTWPWNVLVYDRMRRSSPQVGAVMRAVTLPLRRDIYRLDPLNARDEVVRQISEDIDIPVLGEDRHAPVRSKGRFSWLDHVRLSLLHLVHGHAPFEPVYELRPDRKAHLLKLAYRPPWSIAQINIDTQGELTDIVQYRPVSGPGGARIVIPSERLLWYANEREGAAWAGTSIMRTAYGSWLLGDRSLRVMAMTDERWGMGVPGFEAGPNATPAQMQSLADQAARMRAGESSGGSWPAGTKFTLTGVSGQLPPILDHVRYYDEQIARSMLAQFLQLGTMPHGSRSLAAEQIDFFALSIDAVAKTICTTTTAHVIEDLVDYNWGPDEPAPAIVSSDPTDLAALAAIDLANMVKNGALLMDDELQQWVRDRYQMPPVDKKTQMAPPLVESRAVGEGAPLAVAASAPRTAPRTPRGVPLRAAKGQARVARALRSAVDVEALVASAIKGLPRSAWAGAVSAALHSADADLTPLAAEIRRLRSAGYRAGMAKVKPPHKVAAAAPAPTDEEVAADNRRKLAALLAAADADAARILANRFDAITSSVADVASDDEAEPDDAVAASRGLLAAASTAALIAITEHATSQRTGTTDEARSYLDAASAAESAGAVALAKIPAGQRWVLSDSHEVSDECDTNSDAGTIGIDEDFPEGTDTHPNCLIGSTRVVAPDAELVYRRWYVGQLVELVTASGVRLTITPNHPLLTAAGWMGAGEVDEGAHLVGCRLDEWDVGGGPHDAQVPATIEEQFAAGEVASAMPPVAVPLTPEDFHGDGSYGEVHVVGADRLLRDDVEASGAQPPRHVAFVKRSAQVGAPVGLDGRGSLDQLIEGHRPTSYRGMGGSGDSSVLLRRSTRSVDPHGVSESSGLDSVASKPLDDREVIDPSFIAKGLGVSPAQVSLDEVIGVRRFPTAQWIYNLQTERGWYSAEGIVTHNCLCDIEVVWEDSAVE